jgi:hypothetical protein
MAKNKGKYKEKDPYNQSHDMNRNNRSIEYPAIGSKRFENGTMSKKSKRSRSKSKTRKVKNKTD